MDRRIKFEWLSKRENQGKKDEDIEKYEIWRKEMKKVEKKWKQEKPKLKIIINEEREEVDKEKSIIYINIKKVINLKEQIEEMKKGKNNEIKIEEIIKKIKTKLLKKERKKKTRKKKERIGREGKKIIEKVEKEKEKMEAKKKEREEIIKKIEIRIQEGIKKKIESINKERRKRHTNRTEIKVEKEKRKIIKEKRKEEEQKKEKEEKRKQKRERIKEETIEKIIWETEKKKEKKKIGKKKKKEGRTDKKGKKKNNKRIKKRKKEKNIKFGTYNIDSLNKGCWYKKEIIHRLRNRGIKIMAVQESRMEREIEIIEGWEMISTLGKKDRGNKMVGGV